MDGWICGIVFFLAIKKTKRDMIPRSVFTCISAAGKHPQRDFPVLIDLICLEISLIYFFTEFTHNQ